MKKPNPRYDSIVSILLSYRNNVLFQIIEYSLFFIFTVYLIGFCIFILDIILASYRTSFDVISFNLDPKCQIIQKTPEFRITSPVTEAVVIFVVRSNFLTKTTIGILTSWLLIPHQIQLNYQDEKDNVAAIVFVLQYYLIHSRET